MNESPNDSEETKALRAMLKSAKEVVYASEAAYEDENISNDDALEIEATAMCKLLRCWQFATGKSYSTDELHTLNRLTTRILDGV